MNEATKPDLSPGKSLTTSEYTTFWDQTEIQNSVENGHIEMRYQRFDNNDCHINTYQLSQVRHISIRVIPHQLIDLLQQIL